MVQEKAYVSIQVHVSVVISLGAVALHPVPALDSPNTDFRALAAEERGSVPPRLADFDALAAARQGSASPCLAGEAYSSALAGPSPVCIEAAAAAEKHPAGAAAAVVASILVLLAFAARNLASEASLVAECLLDTGSASAPPAAAEALSDAD